MIFNCLRKHIQIFISLLTLIASDTLNESTIIKEMSKRFEPGEQYLNADTYITTIIDNSHDTLTSGVMDTFYRYTRFVKENLNIP